jgi:phenylpyruvate tautomerase PptA (4-oxalocrotonate tautomerase family)
MPVIFIEAPPGIRPDAKKSMVKKITVAIEEAYSSSETLIFLREYSRENVAVNGSLSSENPKNLETADKAQPA